jgi:hypothetical protein
MANRLWGHQAIFTTIQTTPLNNVTSNIKVRGGVWSGQAVGNTLTIVDLAGKTFTFVAPSGDDINIGPLGWIRGITVPTMTTGTLNLYLDR